MRTARLIASIAIALLFIGVARDLTDQWIDRTELPAWVAETSTEVLDRKGQLLRAFQVSDGRWRLAVDAQNVDAEYVQMLLRYEDNRFFNHSGIDLIAMLRATGQAIWNGEVISGGSTLTMQVARLLEESGTGKWRSKLRQIRVALALERRLGKTEILSLYLQHAPFGGNLEGVRSATRAYFGKDAVRLTPAEAALLVALPQSPETRRLDRHSDVARQARNRVLRRLQKLGLLDDDTTRAAIAARIPDRRRPFPQLAPHVADRVRDASTAGVIRTSLDSKSQKALESLASEAVAKFDNRLSIAILVADHQTGEIIASVGSAKFANTRGSGFVDMTQALRSPGSTLKPLIYAMAFEDGLAHPETLIEDRPTSFGTYSPQNFDGIFRGELRVREALQASLNLPVVTLLDRLGPSNLTVKLNQIGVQYVIPGDKPGLAVGLGGLGISLQDMVQIYATLARQGSAIPLSLELEPNLAQTRVVSRRASWYVGDILSGIPAPRNARSHQIAYKTGTSYGHRDAWAIGYDGQHVIGVWMGRPDGTPVPGAFGGELAAPVLFQSFQRIKTQIDPLPPAPSDALMVSNSELPAPLRAFAKRGVERVSRDKPEVSFPPDGARIATQSEPLYVQIRNGAAPFTWLANGVPVETSPWDRQAEVRPDGPGYLSITVIDAKGRSTQTKVFVE